MQRGSIALGGSAVTGQDSRKETHIASESHLYMIRNPDQETA